VAATRNRGDREPARRRPPVSPPPTKPSTPTVAPATNVTANTPQSPSPPSNEESSRGPVALLTRACRLLIVFILVLIPCLYPLRLPDRAIAALRSHSDAWWHRFYVTQFDAFLNYGYQPLPLKEGAFTILTTLLVLCWFARRVMQSRLGRLPRTRAFDWRIYGPIIALLAWSAVGLICSAITLFAAQTAAHKLISRSLLTKLFALLARALSPLASRASPLATPTFYWSLVTFALMAAGLLWFLVVYDLPKNPRQVRRWFNAVVLTGFIVGFFAFLQDVDRRRWITGLFFVNVEEAARHDITFLRQRMGSLIGHNIGVAGLLSFSWFILWSRLFQPGTWKRKALWASLLVLFFYVIAATQTRGVWIVLAVLTPCHWLWLMRLTHKRPDLKPIFGGILIILIILTLQIIPSPRNPFYTPESPLLIRFTHFSPTFLLSETRLRIAVCSSPLIAHRPFRGYGLGSFQYVYPPAQADYFAAHPDTVLSPTSNFTVQAHSDWLQLMIELGLPGLLIVLAGLYLALRQGWDSWLTICDPSLRLELTAALMGVAGVMIHALADFPVHVVSTITPALFFLAIWASCGRIEETPVAPAPAPAAGPPDFTPTRGLSAVLAPAALIVAVPAAIVLAGWFYTILQASMYESLGTSFRIYYGEHANDPDMTESEKRRVLAEAYAALKKGHKAAPLDGEIVYRLGEVATLFGVLDVIEVAKTRAASDPKSKQTELVARMEADVLLREGIAWLTDCQSEIRRHEMFHNLGLAYENLFSLYGREEDRLEAKKNYRLAVRYSPCFTRSLYRLFVLLQKDRPPNEEELREVCRQIARYDQPMFQRQFVEPVLTAARRLDMKPVALRIDVPLDAAPQQIGLWLLKVHALSWSGRGAEAEALFEGIRKMFPEARPDLLLGQQMETAMAAGRYAEGVRLAEGAMAVPELKCFLTYYRCARAAALEKLGRPEAKAEWEEIEKLAASDPQYLSGAAYVFLFLMPNPDRAYGYVARYCQSVWGAESALLRIAAEMSFQRGEKEQGSQFLKRCLEFDGEDPQALALQKTMKP